MKAWIGAAALLLSTTAMAAYDDSGAGLLRDCKAFVSPAGTQTILESGYSWRCMGNMEAVVVTLKRLSEVEAVRPLLCPSNVENMSNEIMARIIIKYLEDNPKELTTDRATLVMVALIDAMPCK